MASADIGIHIKAFDQTTSVVRKINRSLNSIQAPIKRVQASFSQLSRASGLDRLTGATSRLGSQIARMGAISTGVVGGGLLLLKNTVIDTSAQFERYEAILTSVEGSSEKARASMDWVSDFAAKTPLQLDEVMASFVSLRTFGLDPMDGTLQALVDQNAKLGGGASELQGIILQLGQAWTKNKLQMEDVIPLQQRGVAVTDLLSKALGKTTEEISDMISHGKIGRDAIRLLIDEIGKSSAGASAEQMKTFGGLVSNLSDQWVRFQKMVADAGIFDLIKTKVASLLDKVNELAKSGKLREWAQTISDSLSRIVEQIGPAITRIASFSKSISDFVGGPGNLFKIAIIGFAAVITGPLLSAIATFSAVLLTTPIGWFVGAIGLIAGLAIAVKNNWGSIINWFRVGFGFIAALPFGGMIGAIILNFDRVVSFASKMWTGVRAAWNIFLGWIKQAIPTLTMNILRPAWSALVSFAASMWASAKSAWAAFAGWVTQFAQILSMENLISAWSSVVAFAASMWDGVKSAWASFAGWVSSFWNSISGPFNAVKSFISGGSVSIVEKSAASIGAGNKSNIAPLGGFKGASNNSRISETNNVKITVNQQPGESGESLAKRVQAGIRSGGSKRGALYDEAA